MHLPAILLWLLTMVLAGSPQQPTPEGADVTFPSGIHLRLRADDTTQADANRYLTVRNPEDVYRLVSDSHGRLLFGYEISAFPDTRPGEIRLEIKPLNSKVLPLLREHGVSVGDSGQAQLPTFEAERDFGGVPGGSAVPITADLPSGAKIIDSIEILSPQHQPSTREATPVFSGEHSADTFRLAELRVWMNGKEVTGSEPLSSVTGPYPALYIPGHGSFFLALEPIPNLPFVQAGSITRTKMRFTVGTDVVDCASTMPILRNQDSALIWIWHEPRYQLDFPQFDAFLRQPKRDKLQIAVADSTDVWRTMVSRPER